MAQSPLLVNPETRIAALHALGRLPWLLHRALRWRALRGGGLPGYLRRHRSFDRRAFPPNQTIDVIVLCGDHFEPARRFGDEAAE